MQVKRVRCEASGVLVAKDKAIKRFIVRNIVDASAIRDIQDSSILEGNAAPSGIAHEPMLSTHYKPPHLVAGRSAGRLLLMPAASQQPVSAGLHLAIPSLVLCCAGYALPKIYRKVYYCVSAAIHSKVVRVRNRQERKNREPPKR